MKRQGPGAGILLALLLAVLVLPLPGVARAQAITLEPEQLVVEAGSAIRFIGTNFQPGEKVGWWATAPDGVVLGGEEVRASRDRGYIEILFDVPSHALGGRWAMTAYGNLTQVPVIATFEVIGRAPEQVDPEDFDVKVAPPVGPPGTRFAFAATGFDEEEDVSYWITAPAGTVYAAYPKGETADNNGRIDFAWTAPFDAPRGVWVMTMQGYDSGVARGIRFEIR